MIYCECKKPRHFKFECLDLEKTKDKKKHFKTRDKKVLMRIWEDWTAHRLTKRQKKKQISA